MKNDLFVTALKISESVYCNQKCWSCTSGNSFVANIAKLDGKRKQWSVAKVCIYTIYPMRLIHIEISVLLKILNKGITEIRMWSCQEIASFVLVRNIEYLPKNIFLLFLIYQIYG